MDIYSLPNDSLRYIATLLEKENYHDAVFCLRIVSKHLNKSLTQIIGCSPKKRGKAIGDHGSVNMLKESKYIGKDFIKSVFLSALSANNTEILSLFEINVSKIEKLYNNDRSIEDNYPLLYITNTISLPFMLIDPISYIYSLGKCDNITTIDKYVGFYPCIIDILTPLIRGSLIDDDPDKSMRMFEWLSKNQYPISEGYYYSLIHIEAAVKTFDRLFHNDYEDLINHYKYNNFNIRLPSNISSYSKNVDFLANIINKNINWEFVHWHYPLNNSLTISPNVVYLKFFVDKYGEEMTKNIILRDFDYIIRCTKYSTPQGDTINVKSIIELMKLIGNYQQKYFSPQNIYKIVCLSKLHISDLMELLSYLISTNLWSTSSLKMKSYFALLRPMKAIKFLIEAEKHHLTLLQLGLREGHILLVLNKNGANSNSINPRWPFMANRAIKWLCNPSRDDHQWKFYFDRLNSLNTQI